MVTLLLLFDFSKAFKAILLQKLKQSSVNRKAMKCFFISTHVRASQRSVFEPLLFALFEKIDVVLFFRIKYSSYLIHSLFAAVITMHYL